MNPLVLIAIRELPHVIDFLQSAFVKANPGSPMPTSSEVLVAYQQALNSSLAKDATWLAANGR